MRVTSLARGNISPIGILLLVGVIILVGIGVYIAKQEESLNNQQLGMTSITQKTVEQISPTVSLAQQSPVTPYQTLQTSSPIDTRFWTTDQTSNHPFVFQYPSGWTSQVTGNSTNNDGTLEVDGPEGMVNFAWGTGSGVGGGCATQYHKTITLGEETVDSCDRVAPDGSESWDNIGKQVGNTTVLIRAKANNPNQVNRQTILTILSTVKFKN